MKCFKKKKNGARGRVWRFEPYLISEAGGRVLRLQSQKTHVNIPRVNGESIGGRTIWWNGELYRVRHFIYLFFESVLFTPYWFFGGCKRALEERDGIQWKAIKLYFFSPHLLPNKPTCIAKQKGNRCTLEKRILQMILQLPPIPPTPIHFEKTLSLVIKKKRERDSHWIGRLSPELRLAAPEWMNEWGGRGGGEGEEAAVQVYFCQFFFFFDWQSTNI